MVPYKKTFRGGIHPRAGYGGKAATSASPIRDLPAGARVYVMLSQHVGAPCAPLVKVGDRVLLGQKIGESDSYVSAPVHASVSGKVAAIPTSIPAPNGMPGQAIVIDNDGLDEWDPAIQPAKDVGAMDRGEMLARIHSAGLAGMGGAAFPTHVKLSPPEGKKIDTLLLNGAECEPFLTADHRKMLERPDQIVEGLLLARKILSAGRGLIGIEDNKPDAIESMTKACAGTGISVVSLKTKYPQGGEKQLIYTLTGRQVPSGGLPMDIGVVVLNVSTAANIRNALYNGTPLIERVVTVTGMVAKPANFRARIGTPISELIAACGGALNGAQKMIVGGPMMGMAVYGAETPVVKGTSGVLLLPDFTPKGEPGNCIRCGKCGEKCPIRLMPMELHALSRRALFDRAAKEHAMDCIECGACSYGCPSGLPLVQSIRVAKREITKRKK